MSNISDSELIVLAQKARQFIELGQQLLNAARIHDLEVPDMVEIEKAVYGKAVVWFDDEVEKRVPYIWRFDQDSVQQAWLKFIMEINEKPSRWRNPRGR